MFEPSGNLAIRRIAASCSSDNSGMSEKLICESDICLTFLSACLRGVDGLGLAGFISASRRKFFSTLLSPTETTVRKASLQPACSGTPAGGLSAGSHSQSDVLALTAAERAVCIGRHGLPLNDISTLAKMRSLASKKKNDGYL